MARLTGLDALRGIAALLVVLHHLLGPLGTAYDWPNQLLQLVSPGSLGVAAFFLISGYVVPASIRGTVWEFAVGRACRILPVLWVSIAIMLLVEGFSPGTMLANMFLLARLTGHDQVQSVYWTLELELVFYGVVAGLFVAGRLNDRRALHAAVAASAVAGLFAPLVAVAGLMPLGSLLRQGRGAPMAIWIVLAGAVAATLIHERPVSWLAGIVLALPLFLVSLKAKDAPPFLLSLGRISYPIYLLHLPAIIMTGRVSNWPVYGAAFATCALAITLLLAIFAHYAVERPGMALGRMGLRNHLHREPRTVGSNVY